MSASSPVVFSTSSRPLSLLTGPVQPELLRDERLHEIFAAAAARAPEKAALRCAGETWTYGELRARAARCAHFLRGLGVRRGVPVILWLPRGPEAYPAFLGVLEAGGCYVPLDADFPPDRVAFAAQDAGAHAILTTRALAARLTAAACPVLALEDARAQIDAQPATPFTRAECGAESGDPAYLIYTSGTTGRPKGVAIAHRAACHFVRSEGSVLRLTEADVVFQGLSLSFDMSLEEIWLPFAAGATLVVGTPEQMREPAELSGALARAGVTVWNCVPTLLALQEAPVPTLRLLNLGGEACPPELVKRWSAPGRRLLNTYGPTEAAVTATWAEVTPGRPITIGLPLPNFTVALLDEAQQLVPEGETGELCIGGPGLAIGYVGRPELTREKFIRHEALGRLYRSGDAARVNRGGELEFLGRIDSQVKIRGYRVELGEIEAVLLQDPALRQASAGLWKDEAGAEILTAWIVPRPGAVPDPAALRRRLREQLPGYMVPARVAVLARLPVLPNGKVDRRNLPAPAAPETAPDGPPVTPAERRLHAVWSEVFAGHPVSCDHDFFADLGGHSLTAAALISRLRREPDFRHLAVGDLYAHPTVRRLAVRAEAGATERVADLEPFAPVSGRRHFACGLAQALALPVIFAFYALPLLGPYLAWLRLAPGSRFLAALAAAGVCGLLLPVMLLAAAALKWLILGREKPGRYPLWGRYYYRWWLAARFQGLGATSYLTGTPLAAWYYRLLGARLGRHVHLGTNGLSCPGLIEIAEGATIARGVSLLCARVEGGWLKIDPIRIGPGCVIGHGSTVQAGATMEARAQLGELSLLAEGALLPAGEIWSGSPARRTGQVVSPAPARGPGHPVLFTALVLIFPAFLLTPIVPGLALLSLPLSWLVLAPLLAISYVLSMCGQIAAAKWLLVGRLQPGRHSLASAWYLRWWLMDKFLQLGLDTIHPLYATIYLPAWFRLLGVRVGPRAEISTAMAVSPDLVTLGAESFIADAVVLGAPRLGEGEITLERTEVGARSFVGNSGLLPTGTTIGAHSLIGCLSVPPVEEGAAARPHASWFGTPAVHLPRRQPSRDFGEGSTFRPGLSLFLQRAAIEGVRVILALTVLILINARLLSAVAAWNAQPGLGALGLAARFTALYLGLALLAGVFVLALKWLVIGRYVPREAPLWSRFVWRSELVTYTGEQLAEPLLLNHLLGTPFLPWYWRLMGARIGRRVYCGTTDLTEFDVARVGDDAALNTACGLQTHLFEDRVMKISHVDVGARCTVGANAIVLYDTRMENDAKLDALSLLMKGETLPAGTAWRGSPARRI